MSDEEIKRAYEAYIRDLQNQLRRERWLRRAINKCLTRLQEWDYKQ